MRGIKCASAKLSFVENVMSGDNGTDRKILRYCFEENCGKLFNVRMYVSERQSFHQLSVFFL